jgi:hypothetical protein
MDVTSPRKQVNIRVALELYHALEVIARQERRSVPQAARLLLEEGLRQRTGGGSNIDDVPSGEISVMAMAGGAFNWLEDEPELYDDTCGEPV